MPLKNFSKKKLPSQKETFKVSKFLAWFCLRLPDIADVCGDVRRFRSKKTETLSPRNCLLDDQGVGDAQGLQSNGGDSSRKRSRPESASQGPLGRPTPSSTPSSTPAATPPPEPALPLPGKGPGSSPPEGTAGSSPQTQTPPVSKLLEFFRKEDGTLGLPHMSAFEKVERASGGTPGGTADRPQPGDRGGDLSTFVASLKAGTLGFTPVPPRSTAGGTGSMGSLGDLGLALGGPFGRSEAEPSSLRDPVPHHKTGSSESGARPLGAPEPMARAPPLPGLLTVGPPCTPAPGLPRTCL